ncbi:putative ribosome quality control (RQC) complex YloA/Tae2 family protein [Streptohalobacillus salinus]|uniref:Rqc2 homolog RqcH n=1 Tax=Streptohalobacillus salinus TaxID=621096 RepID=A0A2V3WGP7_9BACI|nr:NFACT RNA binding domain-containing protein [Streptohalobacillus salinus]PXW92584.1 putative ribosome quality control (RQC) complex YloA/Tae2 family protein [Streptohalobacillus salinus]
MAFDGIVTRVLADELDEALTSGRIMKIYQPTETELILTIRAKGKNHQLLLSSHPVYARMHLTNDRYTNPTEPPMFCMLLRKHIAGSFIESVHQHENERMIKINVRGKNEIGDDIKKQLIVEIMGKHSNILLIDEEKGHILDAIKHVSPNQNRHRTLLPGQPYIYPPEQDKVNPFILSETEIKAQLPEKIEPMAFVSTFMGVSPMFEQSLFIDEDAADAAIISQFITYIQCVKSKTVDPVIHHGKKEDFYVFDLATFTSEKEHIASVNALLDIFYSDKADRDLVKQKASDLIRILKNERDKNVRKIKKQQQSLQKADRAEYFQRQGELLTAHLHLVNQGDTTVNVVDYYDENQASIAIELNPNKTPSENAQAFYKTYQKLKTSKEKLAKEIRKANKDIAYLDQLIEQVEKARVEDIEEIREELVEEGYLKKKSTKKNHKKKNKKPTPDQFYAPDGTPILVGKNNKQNEYLTMKLAHRRDLWFHTKDIPGSHVVIRGENPTEETILAAAKLAAYFSKAQQSSSVPVDYTEIRHVKKPNGAKPGFVTYDHQQTAFVTPVKKEIDQLKQQAHTPHSEQ